MEIRILTQEELPQAYAVWSQAFEHGDREMHDWKQWEEKSPSPRSTAGIWDESGLQATVLTIERHAYFGPEVIVPVGAVCGVACLPASRGKGYAGMGVKFALERMHEAGRPLSMLSPFNWDFYQNLGWAWGGVMRRYSIPPRALKSTPETEYVRAATPEDRPKIEAAYIEYAKRYRGAFVRTPFEWSRFLDDREKQTTYTYVYERDGSIEGYFTFRPSKEKKESYLNEFLVLTHRAERGLLGLLRRHEMQIDKFVWHAPEDDLLWAHHFHWDIETHIRPIHMIRIVDVPGALAYLKPASDARGSVTLAVEDSGAPWNTGTWQIEFADREVRATPTDRAPQVSLDIQALAQAYFGTLTPEQLHAADRLTVHEEAGYTALSPLFAGPVMWNNDEL